MRAIRALPVLLLAAVCAAPPAAALAAPAEPPTVEPQRHPLTEVPKGRSTTEQVLRFPAWLAERPFWLIGRGMEGTLDWVEQKDLIQRVEDLPMWLKRHHLILGPSAQGTGAGLGAMGGVFGRVGPGTAIATTDWTFRRYEAHVLEYRTPLSRSVGMRASGRFDRRTRDNFYGIGASTSKDDRSQYQLESWSAGLTLGWRAGGGWTVRGDGRWVDYAPVERPGDDEHPPTLDVFPGLPGVDGPTMVSGGVTVGRSTRDSEVEGALHVFHDTDGDSYAFNRYALTLSRTFPIFWGDRTLTLRFHGTMTDPRPGHEVPFWLLSELSTRNGLRAYDAWRFRDQDALVMNVEYRFPIWDIGAKSGAAIETVLFFDAGKTAHAIQEELAWREFRSDVGAGLRVRSATAMIARMNIAVAAHEARLEFRMGRDF